MNGSRKKRIVVGISGASGALIGSKVLELLRAAGDVEVHLIVSRAAALTIREELRADPQEIAALADVSYADDDLAAGPASGSFASDGMIVAPCSIRSLSAIAYGQTSNLLTRAADVTLKERRRLVLMVRETPLHAGHLKAMLAVTEMGGIIAPPVPAFYSAPASIDDMAAQMAARALTLVDIDSPALRRWRTDDRPDS